MTCSELISDLAWPIVALIGIWILGPGGLLKSIVGELTERLLKVNSAISELKNTVEQFNDIQRKFSDSTDWVSEFQNKLATITSQIREIKSIAEEQVAQAISEGSKTFGNDPSAGAAKEVTELDRKSPDDMFDDISTKWAKLTAVLKERVGQDAYDGRAIGQMAWILVDKRRKNPLQSTDAELLENLHSQWKRFTRLHATRTDWLTPEVYLGFVTGVERAEKAISGT